MAVPDMETIMTRLALVVPMAGLAWLAVPAEAQSQDQAPNQAQSQTHEPAQSQAQQQTQGQAEEQAPTQSQKRTQGQAEEQPKGLAQDRPPPASEDNHRYSFHRMKDGFVRLDGRTGQLAQCGWSATGWSCKVVPDERTALESEIGRLQRENAALKKSMLARGLDLPGGVKPDAPAVEEQPPKTKAPEAATPPKTPGTAELDRAVAFVKKVWRRLVEMMLDLQRDIQSKS